MTNRLKRSASTREYVSVYAQFRIMKADSVSECVWLWLQVLDYDLQRQLTPYMRDMVPMPGIFDPTFIAANQAERATNVIPGTKAEQVATVRQQLASYKKEHGLDKMIVLWTANTERYAEVKEGLNDTAGCLHSLHAAFASRCPCCQCVCTLQCYLLFQCGCK